MRDLAGLVQGKVEAVGAVGGVGREDGVHVVCLRGVEAVRRVGRVCVRGAVFAAGAFSGGDGG
jgi:hypothetical protein